MDVAESPFADLVERLDHISVAVHDLRASARLGALLGGTFRDGGRSFDGAFLWAQWDLPGGKLELIQPVRTAPADHFLVRFLAERGEGLHHLTLKVRDLQATVAVAEASGFSVVGIDTSHPGWKEAFVHPKSAAGVLVQLAEFTDSSPPAGRTLDDVLALEP